MNFLTTFSTVGIMLLYAIPGFLLVKTKLIKKESISAFAVVQMYFCSPILTIYSLTQATFSVQLLKQMGIFLLIVVGLMVAFLVAFYFIFKKRNEDVRYRVCNLATCLGNVGFLGVPILESLLPDQPNALVFSTVFTLSMNIIAWTIGCTIITKDKKYINYKKILFNPAVIAFIIGLPFFIFSIKIPTMVYTPITVVAKMTAPMCMLILGMRLAVCEPRVLFCDFLKYIIIGVKQVLFPLVCLLVVLFLPIDFYIKQTAVILCACPVASVVLNFSEMLGEGQETAAGLVLLGTILSIVTMPLVLLLI